MPPAKTHNDFSNRPLANFAKDENMKSQINRTHRPRLNALVAALGACLLIVACGGGGGGGGDGGAGGGNGVLTGWQVAQLLETTDGQAGSADVAINANGVGYAVWSQLDEPTARTKIMSSRYANGVWEAPKEVSFELDVNEFALEPKVFVHPDGRATAVWTQPGNVGRDIVGSTTNANGQWRAFDVVHASTGAVPFGLKLVSDDQGNGTAVWGAENTLFASAFRGTTFQPPEQISLDTNRQANSPQVVMRTDVPGQALATWVENDVTDGNRPKVFARAFDGNNWQDAVKLSGGASTSSIVSAAMGADGKAVVTWKQVEGPENFLMVRTSPDVLSGQWDVPTNLFEGNFNNLQVAMDAQGRAVMVYRRSDGAQFDLYAWDFTGGIWKDSGKIEAEDAGDARLIKLGMDASGRAFAVWQQGNAANTDVMANRLDPTTRAWGTAERIETEDRGSAFSPSLAVNANGRALAAWGQTNGTLTPTGEEIESVMGNVFK
jgi:hypothetical protein